MLIRFFYFLRQQQLPVSIPEFISLIQSLCSSATALSLNEFYYLARLSLIKDESLFDRYDTAFSQFYSVLTEELANSSDIPADWLIKSLQKQLSEEDKAKLRAIVESEL